MPTAQSRGKRARSKAEQGAGDTAAAVQGGREASSDLQSRVRSGEISQDEAVKLFFKDFADRARTAGREDLVQGALAQIGEGEPDEGAGPFSPPENVQFASPEDAKRLPAMQSDDDEFLAERMGVGGGARVSATGRMPPPESLNTWLPQLLEVARGPNAPPEVIAFLRRLQITLGLTDHAA